jgi:protocatechuate 3,4-dioxygenase beta subunit
MTGRVVCPVCRVCSLSIVAILAAQQPPSGHPGAIEGTVVNSVTGAPVKKVVATIREAARNLSYAATTDSAGHFQFVNVEPGTYAFSMLAAQGYRQLETDKAFSKPITLVEDQHVTAIKLQMVPLGVITGRVFDDQGEPLTGVAMTAFHYDYSSGTKVLTSAGRANTDDLGTYRLYDLPPGHYIVKAQLWVMRPAIPPNTQFNVPETGFAAVFYPGVGVETRASLVDVLPGAEASGTDFRLERIPVYHVRGKTGIGGTIFQYSVNVCGSTDQQAVASGASRASPDGRFDLADVPAGSYCLEASRNRTLYGVEQIVVANRSLDDVIISPLPVEDIHGTLQIDGTFESNVGTSVHLGYRTSLGTSVPKGGGSFTIRGPTPGAYSVYLMGDMDKLYLKSIEYDQHDVPDGVVNIGTDRAELILHAGTDPGQLTGMVRTANGDPAEETPVVAEPAGGMAGRIDLVKTFLTDANGRFRIKGLAPGDYKVFAWEDSDSDLIMSREFRQEFQSDAAAVTIQPSASASVNLTAVTPAKSEKVRSKFR